MVSTEAPGPCSLEVVRLWCGDPSSRGPGFIEEPVEGPWPTTFPGRHQAVRPGSHVQIDPSPWLDSLTSFTVRVRLWPTRPGEGTQQLIGTNAFALLLDAGSGQPVLQVGDHRAGTGVAVVARRWVELEAWFDAADGSWGLRQTPLPSRRPTDVLLHGPVAVEGRWEDVVDVPTGGPLRLGLGFDGKLEAPALAASARAEVFDVRWDLAADIGTTRVRDVGPHGLHGRTVQTPARAVTGSRWDGTIQRWSDAPEQYAAIHLHRDDLTDAGWEADVTVSLPADLPSGVYAFKVVDRAGSIDRTPFFVLPPRGTSTAAVALLMPTATYYAYANHRMSIDGSEFFPPRQNLRDEFAWLREHPEVGYSMYEYHDDGSGVMFSSRRRPVLNLKPGADGWAFTADTNLVAFLHHEGIDHDILTDDDLHHEGRELLDGYRVLVTGTHPEYWSTAMLDALEGWLAAGGRLLYLGGNGFYWRVAWSRDEPWVMEVRRAEDGTRGWIAEPGEYYHEHGGEYGGLWRRLGRAPNQLVGVGFAAQGFDRASSYRRTPASHDGRAAWIFEGVESPEVFGDYGAGGGAAGQEIDRYDPSLGSPTHAVVLASSWGHSEQMLRTKEEFLATRLPFDDPKVRSDVVFFEGPNGGAVFSVGSISWFGALAHRDYDNDVARITGNVLRRFLDPAPFPLPDAQGDAAT